MEDVLTSRASFFPLNDARIPTFSKTFENYLGWNIHVIWFHFGACPPSPKHGHHHPLIIRFHLLSYKCWHCTAASKGNVILAILWWTVHLPRTRGFWEVHKLWGGLIKIPPSSKDGESPSSIILFHSSSPVPPMAIVDLIGDVEVELLASAPYVSRLIFWTIITNNIAKLSLNSTQLNLNSN